MIFYTSNENNNEKEFLDMIEGLPDEQKAQYQDVVIALQSGTHHLEYSVGTLNNDDDSHSNLQIFLVNNNDKQDKRQITLPRRLRLITADEYMRIQQIVEEIITSNPELFEKRDISIDDINEIIARLPENKQKEYELYKQIIHTEIKNLIVIRRKPYRMELEYNGFDLCGGYDKNYRGGMGELSPLGIREATLVVLKKDERDIINEQARRDGQYIGE